MSYPAKQLYLAGPITGLSYEEARLGWRQEIAGLLPPHIHSFSPMRAKDFLQNLASMPCRDVDLENMPALATGHGIITRDFNDVKNCDAMVACFLGAQRVSIGTCVEFGWASALKKPVILVMEPDGNPHDHAFLTEIAGYRVPTIAEAAALITHLLTPGV